MKMKIEGKKFLVIGGAGFIGSHIVDQLLEKGAREIVVFDNFFRGTKNNIQKSLEDSRVTIFPDGGDILHTEILNEAMKSVDGVFHLAAMWLLQCLEYPRSALDVNVMGTFNVIEAAIKNNIKKVVYSSSASVYGDAIETPMTEKHSYNNYTFYGATKIAGEHFFKTLGHKHQLNWVGLRYMNVYGERQDYKGVYTAVMHKILDRINSNQAPIVYGDGSQMYDFIYVTDVARANILAMESSATGKNYNVGTGIGTTIKDLTLLLLKLKDSKSEIEYKPGGQTFVTHRIGCPKESLKDLQFKYNISIEEGMRKLIHWRNSTSK